MTAQCVTHHQACACREAKIAVLIEAVENYASELDDLKNSIGVSNEERLRLVAVVDKLQSAAHNLKSDHVVGCLHGLDGCPYVGCDECGFAERVVVPVKSQEEETHL